MQPLKNPQFQPIPNNLILLMWKYFLTNNCLQEKEQYGRSEDSCR
ncbi:hypothetical protein Cabys_1461 [Caldithrix abyssi DSM 13497]|uniref:Uncharacterized protein n=1 Tax=Caldithrix abyssi DSM 13497 TaxID=880073 RepID=A0A1J1C882_CALAY|nr:hypothetical protein Cabys_1461 [Caldithrix abyssi DSM 13497]